MTKQLFLLIILSSFISTLSIAKEIEKSHCEMDSDSTQVVYTIFRVKEKFNWYCSSDSSFDIRNFGNNIDDNIHSRLSQKLSEKMKLKENQTVLQEKVIVPNENWIVIYEGVYEFDDCKYKRYSTIVTKDIETISELIEDKITNSLINDHYKSHSIVFKEKVELKDSSYLNKITNFLKNLINSEGLTEEEKEKVSKSTPTGVRG